MDAKSPTLSSWRGRSVLWSQPWYQRTSGAAEFLRDFFSSILTLISDIESKGLAGMLEILAVWTGLGNAFENVLES